MKIDGDNTVLNLSTPGYSEIKIHNINSEDVNLVIPVNVMNRSGDEELVVDVDDVECDLDDEFENDDQVRLNRKRNIPIRKTSFKRKANKSLSDEKLLTSTSTLETSESPFNTSTSNLAENQHRQLTKLSSDSKVICLSTSSFVSSGYITNSDSASSIQKLRLNEQTIAEVTPSQSLVHPMINNTNNNNNNNLISAFNARPLPKQQTFDESQISVGPIQKAKATFRNIMGKSSSETNKRLLKQTMSVKSGMESDPENTYSLMGSKSLSNNDLGNEAANIYLNYSTSQLDIQSEYSSMFTPNIHSFSHQLMSKSKSQDGNFTLLSRHTILDETNFKSGEICAICENPMLTQMNQTPPQAHLKCTECKQLFHKKCIHLSSDIPCIKESSNSKSSVLGRMFSRLLNLIYLNMIFFLLAFNPSRPPRNKQKKAKIFDKNLDAKERQEPRPITGSKDAAFVPTQKSVRVKQFTDPHDVLITDLDELQLMDKFISKKIREMDEVKKKAKESMVDIVFKRALREFKANLISTYSVGTQDGYFRLTYKDLIDHFEQVSKKID